MPKCFTKEKKVRPSMLSLDDLIQGIEAETKQVIINKRKYRFLVPSSIEKFLDPEDIFCDFPLWAKIWET